MSVINYSFRGKAFKMTRKMFAAGTILVFAFSPALTMAALKLGTEAPPVQLAPGSPALALQNAFIDVAAKVSPAVVNISSEWTENLRGFDDFGGMPDFFNFWFYGPQGRSRMPRQFKQKQRSLGSGFLITSNGYIVTNAHVIGKAEKVTVTFEDGTAYPAKIIGKDERTDIGVIKISDGKKTFPHVVLGNSEGVQVGQWAIAIGNPFALDHTVTTGVISAKGRSVQSPESESTQDYIQTDASINPGNSGGPLCDIQGEVIGINSMIYSQSGGSVGIGFAIPVNLAKKVAEDLVNEGKVTRSGLGVIVQGLDSKMAKSFGLTSTEGVLISAVNPESAAEKAGLKPGDIVLEISGEKVSSSADLVSKLYTYKPGETIQVTILRKGQKNQIPVTLQVLSDKDLKMGEKPSSGGEEENGTNEPSELGWAYQDQTPELQKELPPGAPKGPVITQVGQQSPAAAAGLRPGDVILKVGDTQIVSTNQLTAVLKKSDLKEGVRLFVWRNGVTVYALLQTGDE